MRREGWDALPLAAKELAAANLWSSPKAAERWLAKNPPEAYRDTIRVWGLLAIAVQRSWSRALVRVGADPRAALAAVLG
jgi:hypothetical protein